MAKYYIITGLGQLVVTILVGIVTRQAQGITLLHLHIAKSLEGVGLLIEVCTVTEQVCALMTKMHITMQHLSITIAILIVVQIVRMYQVHAFILHLFSWSALALWLCSKGNSQHQQSQNNR